MGNHSVTIRALLMSLDGANTKVAKRGWALLSKAEKGANRSLDKAVSKFAKEVDNALFGFKGGKGTGEQAVCRAPQTRAVTGEGLCEIFTGGLVAEASAEDKAKAASKAKATAAAMARKATVAKRHKTVTPKRRVVTCTHAPALCKSMKDQLAAL